MTALKEQLEAIGVFPEEDQIRKLLTYRDRILDRNRFLNLTAVTDPEEFLIRHYVDSAAVMDLPEYQRADEILDLGTGAGFPGIPLAILSPDKNFTLVDSLQKRLKVITEFAGEIGIPNVRTVHKRAEDLGRDPQFRGRMDLCLSRAVADMTVLSEYCLPLVRTGGIFIAYKGLDSEQEVQAAEHAILILGGRPDRIEEFSSAGMRHTLVVIRKEKNTPKQYPRKAGTPAKSPIK